MLLNAPSKKADGAYGFVSSTKMDGGPKKTTVKATMPQ